MDDKKFRIPPNKWVLLLFAILFIVGGGIFFVKYDGAINDDSRDIIFVMILIIIVMFSSLKRYDFTYEGVSVRYIPIFMSRRVDISRIQSVTLVNWYRNGYIIIQLDNCPTLDNTVKFKGYIDWYALLHPVKAICIRFLSANELVEYQNMIRELYPYVKIDVIDKDYKW